MKFIKIFSVFILLHVAAWGATHAYLSKNSSNILLVVDTSYAMKPKFNEMKEWIIDLESSSHYKQITIGTDKALLGNLEELKSKDVIFRTAFGRMNLDNLNRYTGTKAKKRIFLSDGSIKPDGWEIVIF
ncbi:MAG TPA: hypothetical protein EYG68_04510 [Leucothrix mucor]|nr:hypothetical protein [Leucothrix mucor]